MECYKELGWSDPEGGMNDTAPVLFKDFYYRGFKINKSYHVSEEEIRAASRTKKINSISIIEALKLRWEVKIPRDEYGRITKKFKFGDCRVPLHEFVKEHGYELWLDMNEVMEMRIEL